MALRRWLKVTLWIVASLVVLAIAGVGFLWWYFNTDDLDSGGPLRPRQAAYDVRRYDLAVAVDPATKSIRGTNRTTVVATARSTASRSSSTAGWRSPAPTVDGAAATFEHADGSGDRRSRPRRGGPASGTR